MPKPHAIGCACGRALRRSVPLVVATCAMAAVGGAVWGAHHFVTTSPRFALASIEVRGTERLSADEIRASLPVSLGDNVFSADLDELSGIARRHPWIASATAQRILPNQLVIEVREYEAAAIAVLDVPYLVDAKGNPFKRASMDDGDGKDLPVITGLDRAMYRRDPRGTAQTIVSALSTLATWQADGKRPSIGEVHIDSHGALTFHTYDRGTAVQLGRLDSADAARGGFDRRMQAFDAAWNALDTEERERARAINVIHRGRSSPGARTSHVTVAFKD